MPKSVQFIAVESGTQVSTVVDLAREIWCEYYVPLIGLAQVDYMLAKFQSVEALLEQRRNGFEYFLIQQAQVAIGYVAVQGQPNESQMFISKFYLRKSARGAGTGRLAMTFIERMARQRALRRLWLTVNKGNVAAQVYERLGFHVETAVVIDIGNSFVMDDFRMEKLLV